MYHCRGVDNIRQTYYLESLPLTVKVYQACKNDLLGKKVSNIPEFCLSHIF